MMKKIIIFSVLVLTLLVAGLAACNTVSSGPLPHSMKGYELYSWQESGQWRFTLITGTNRSKTLEEITSGKAQAGEDGWVNFHVTGVDAIKTALSRVPSGEFVFWLGGQGITESGQPMDIRLELPPAGIINEIKEHTVQHGLGFQIANN